MDIESTVRNSLIIVSPCNNLVRLYELLLCLWVEKKNQLDATEWLIALNQHVSGNFMPIIKELETICVLLPPMVCSALVAGCRRSGAEQQAMLPG